MTEETGAIEREAETGWVAVCHDCGWHGADHGEHWAEALAETAKKALKAA